MDNDANDSVDARHGTLQGEAGFTTSAAIGSHALSLDGDDDYVDLTAHAADLPQGDAARSIAGWFRPTIPCPALIHSLATASMRTGGFSQSPPIRTRCRWMFVVTSGG